MPSENHSSNPNPGIHGQPRQQGEPTRKPPPSQAEKLAYVRSFIQPRKRPSREASPGCWPYIGFSLLVFAIPWYWEALTPEEELPPLPPKYIRSYPTLPEVPCPDSGQVPIAVLPASPTQTNDIPAR